ncbi:MAG: hypothetical protein ACK5LX_06545 [Oscillospiraceae bacterium]
MKLFGKIAAVLVCGALSVLAAQLLVRKAYLRWSSRRYISPVDDLYPPQNSRHLRRVERELHRR